MSLPVIFVVGAILEDDHGRILLAQRPANKSMPFLWEFPGGKMESDESPEQALVRELEEELGILLSPHHIKPFSFISKVYPNFHIVLLGYECLQWIGTPYARENQGGIEWVQPQDLINYPMPDANYAFIPLLQGRIKNTDVSKLKKGNQ